MTPALASFRPQYLLIVSVLWLACAGGPPTDPMPSNEGGSGGSVGAGGEGGSGGRPVIDAAVTFFVDRAPDLTPDTPTPDLALPSPVPAPPGSSNPDASAPATPDSAPAPVGGAIVISACSQIPCQMLFQVAAGCTVDTATGPAACISQVTGTDPATTTNYCYANGVIKRSTLTDDGTSYQIVMHALRPDHSACYTLQMNGTQTGDYETQVWMSPGGVTLLSGTWIKSLDRLIVSCNGMTYDTRDVDCPGLDGEPSTGPQCPAGNCPD